MTSLHPEDSLEKARCADAPLVSIIVPIYKVEKYIGQCIESILLQTYDNLEVVLINDGSPDNSGVIVDAYALRDDRIKVIHQNNAGVSSARNAGIGRATGDFLCFVDGDDALAEDFVEHMLRLGIQNSADLVISTSVLTSPEAQDWAEENIEIWSPEKATAELLYPEIPLGAWNKLYKRSLVESNSLRFPEDYFMGEGLNFITAASQCANKIVTTNHRAYYYRRDNIDSATTKPSVEKMKNALLAINNVRKNLRIRTPDTLVALDFHYWLTSFHALRSIHEENGLDTYKEFYLSCRETVRNDSLRMLLSARISLKRKLKIALIWLSPEAAIWLIGRIKA